MSGSHDQYFKQVETYFKSVQDFLDHHIIKQLDWPDLQLVIKERQTQLSASSYMWAAMLPIMTCLTFDGHQEKAVPLAASWLLYDLASKLFDDLQDQDDESLLWFNWNPTRLINVGLGTIAAADLCLTQLDCSLENYKTVQSDLAKAFLLAARGQTISLANPNLENYYQHTIAKSGLLFAAVAKAGANLATNNPKVLEQIYTFGLALGTLIQILDDCYDMRSKAANDLGRGHYTLPVIFAVSQQEHPLHSELTQLSGNLADRNAIKKIITVLEEMKAFEYALSIALVYKHKALSALEDLPQTNTSILQSYLSRLIPEP